MVDEVHDHQTFNTFIINWLTRFTIIKFWSYHERVNVHDYQTLIIPWNGWRGSWSSNCDYTYFPRVEFCYVLKASPPDPLRTWFTCFLSFFLHFHPIPIPFFIPLYHCIQSFTTSHPMPQPVQFYIIFFVVQNMPFLMIHGNCSHGFLALQSSFVQLFHTWCLIRSF